MTNEDLQAEADVRLLDLGYKRRSHWRKVVLSEPGDQMSFCYARGPYNLEYSVTVTAIPGDFVLDILKSVGTYSRGDSMDEIDKRRRDESRARAELFAQRATPEVGL